MATISDIIHGIADPETGVRDPERKNRPPTEYTMGQLEEFVTTLEGLMKGPIEALLKDTIRWDTDGSNDQDGVIDTLRSLVYLSFHDFVFSDDPTFKVYSALWHAGEAMGGQESMTTGGYGGALNGRKVWAFTMGQVAGLLDRYGDRECTEGGGSDIIAFQPLPVMLRVLRELGHGVVMDQLIAQFSENASHDVISPYNPWFGDWDSLYWAP